MSVVTVHGTGLSGPSVTATVQMANNISFVMAKENFLNDSVAVEEARGSENVLVISGSRTAVTSQVESWNGKGLVDGFDISGGGDGGGPTVKNASVGVHDGIIQQDRDYRIVVSGEIKEVPDNSTRIGVGTVSGVSRAPGLRSIFTYTGEITSFEADRKVSIKQDGQIIREGTQEPPPDPDPPPNEQPPNDGDNNGGNDDNNSNGGGSGGNGDSGGGNTGGNNNSAQAGLPGGLNASTLALMGVVGIGVYLGQNN